VTVFATGADPSGDRTIDGVDGGADDARTVVEGLQRDDDFTITIDALG